jgi:AcrR family transcriptional regulator
VTENSNIARRRKAAFAEGGAEYKAKRHELVQVAVKLFKERGYKSTSLNDIAKSAGLDRATLYYYVASKEQLFQEAVQGVLDANLREAERLLKIATLGPREKLELLFERLMASYEENYPHTYVYIQEQMQHVEAESTPWERDMVQQTKRFKRIVTLLLKEGTSAGAFREDVSVELAANMLFGMFNWTHRWHRPGGKLSPRLIAEAFCKVFFDGMQDSPAAPFLAGQLPRAAGNC